MRVKKQKKKVGTEKLSYELKQVSFESMIVIHFYLFSLDIIESKGKSMKN